MNDITLTAADARKLTQQAQSLNGSYKRAETDKILQTIQITAAMGKAETNAFDTDEVIQMRLKALGFTVKYVPGYDQRDSPYLQITW